LVSIFQPKILKKIKPVIRFMMSEKNDKFKHLN